MTPLLPYRAWSLCCYTGSRELFERHFSRALSEAPKYDINRLELLDYYIPWVNFGIAYRAFPKLQDNPTLYTYKERGVCWSPWPHVRDLCYADAPAYIKDVFRRVKRAGLKLNVWYHVGRDIPCEVRRDYPEYCDMGTGFVYQFEAHCLAEFFATYPEVDGLVVTSIHETDSILGRAGDADRRERLFRLYTAIYAACRKAGKEMILRDFIVKKADYDDFTAVLDRLPCDIIVMTKEILADWCFIRQEKNPYISRYRGRRLVVEFDLYGEYQGRTDIPYADPEYFYKSIRDLLPFHIEGAVGRIVHDYERESQFPTIFDSLNAINVSAFSRTLVHVGPTLESLGEWAPTMYSDPGLTLWLPWAVERFGTAAAPDAVTILRQCVDLVYGTLTVCGFNEQFNSRFIGSNIHAGGWNRRRFDPIHPEGIFENWVQREPLALAMIRSEKDDLTARTDRLERRTKLLVQDIGAAESVATLVKAVENLNLTAHASRAIALLYALGVQTGGDVETQLKTESQGALRLADELAARRGENFYFNLSQTLRDWAELGWRSSDHEERTY